jgi:signal transduction histidine kinase
METVAETGRGALHEMRRLLGVLRTTSSDAVDLVPQPGVAEIEALVANVRVAGLPVDLTVDGSEVDLPAGMELAAYRIVQEALTNTLRHANAGRAKVQLDCTGEVVAIEVVDDGRGPHTSRAPGHGLIGMRERVAVYGGTLDTGARVGRGYRVSAQLPYEVEQTV